MAKKAAKRNHGIATKLLPKRVAADLKQFFKSNWIGTVVIFVATLVFFLPLIVRINSYSEGGDAMFNAWILSRNHNCIVRNGCPDYTDANIYYPNEDTMLYSENQLSAGLLTLPVYFFSKNPILAYNLWIIVSMFLGGWFMYLLAKHLSKGNEYFSVLAALVFEFAPFKMAAAHHMQNLSILYLPLAVLLILKFFESSNKRFLYFLFPVLVLQFYASWVQMVFVLMILGILLFGMLVSKLVKPKLFFQVGAVVVLAVLSILPLAFEYMRFSKETNATFSIREQILYSSSLSDYILPHYGTLIGKAYYWINPDSVRNSHNPDSYSYHGIILYSVAIGLVYLAYRYRKQFPPLRRYLKLIGIFLVMILIGVTVSLGPLLKIKKDFVYGNIAGADLTAPLPWLLVMKFLPQLSIVRAIGRASILVLFALCCLLALLPVILNVLRREHEWLYRHKRPLYILIGLFIFIELMPLHTYRMSSHANSYNIETPKVYEYIRNSDEIDNIVILNADYDYPNAPVPIARAEQVMWAGYHNKNIFNGYSGYTPPTYVEDFENYVDFRANDIPRLHNDGLNYVLVDKELSTTKPWVYSRVSSLLPDKVYEDERYALFKVTGN